MNYVLIQGPSYRSLDFEAREKVRENLRIRLENHGLRWVEYHWVWDEEDRCLLLTGCFEHLEDADQIIEMLQSLGFEICIRHQLPGETN